MASVRFICGTQDQHLELEAQVSPVSSGRTTAVLFSSCFDANGGVFEVARRTERDAVISDELNHASIIDGIRLTQGTAPPVPQPRPGRPRGASLTEAADARRRLIVTDGVFSMDGYLAPLPEICDLAERHDALVVVDDSHAVGFVGATGAGTPELHGRPAPRRHRHRHPGQGPRRCVRRIRGGTSARSSTCSASARAPTCSRTAVAPPVVAGYPRRARPGRRAARTRGSGCGPTAGCSAP